MLDIQESAVDPANIPRPTGYRLLIEPIQVEAKTESGFLLPEVAKKAKEVLRYIGKVVAIGPEAYKHDKFEGGRWCEVGDWIAYGQYAGQEIAIKNQTSGVTLFRIINDDEVLAKIPDPKAVLIYV